MAEWVDAEEAVTLVQDIIYAVGTVDVLDVIVRVIITDGLDNCAFEWKFKEGVVFPKLAE